MICDRVLCWWSERGCRSQLSCHPMTPTSHGRSGAPNTRAHSTLETAKGCEGGVFKPSLSLPTEPPPHDAKPPTVGLARRTVGCVEFQNLHGDVRVEFADF